MKGFCQHLCSTIYTLFAVTLDSPQYTVHSIQHTCTQYTEHNAQCIIQSIHSAQYTVRSIQHTARSGQFTVYSAQYTLNKTQCTVHSAVIAGAVVDPRLAHAMLGLMCRTKSENIKRYFVYWRLCQNPHRPIPRDDILISWRPPCENPGHGFPVLLWLD
jgi:hypothetical protein